MLRVLHDVKFFLPTLLSRFSDKTTRDKKQLEVVLYFVDECLRQNSQRGRQGRPPLNYQEARKVAQSALHNIYSGSGVGLVGDLDLDVISFDPYTAGGGVNVGGGFGSRNQRRRGRGGFGQAAGGSGGSGSAGGAGLTPGGGSGSGGGPLPCRAWNTGACTWTNCKFSHFCNAVLQSGAFCKKNHKAKDHK